MEEAKLSKTATKNEERERPPLNNQTSKNPDDKNQFNKYLKMSENFIISQNNHYVGLKQQIRELANNPRFNRFISLKKQKEDINSEKILNKYKHFIKKTNQNRPPPTEAKFNRRQLYFMRQRRPAHNSPVKRRTQKQADFMQPQNKIKNKKVQKLLEQNIKEDETNEQQQKDEIQSSNALLIKQMVTKINTPLNTTSNGLCLKEEQLIDRDFYVTEVIRTYMEPDSLARDSILNSIFFLQLLGHYNVPKLQPKITPLTLSQKPYYKNKITVVFDLDETLVHCFEELSEPHQVQIPVSFLGGVKMLAPVNIRPGTKQILEQLAKDFELMIFTASHQSYADAVINYLDPRKELIQHRLYRRNCQYIEEGYHIKDLRILGRDLSRTVLVDNAAYSYCFQISNGIPILPYYQGKNDYQLKALRDYLYKLKNFNNDVRILNQATFKMSEYIKYTQVEELVPKLYL